MQIKDKHIEYILWVISIACIILGALLLSLLSSCGVADHIEASHYHYYYDTKALIVVKEEKPFVYCTSPAGVKFYRIRNIYGEFHLGDTILLRDMDNYYIFGYTKFIKKIPGNECSHSKKSPRRKALQHNSPVPLHE